MITSQNHRFSKEGNYRLGVAVAVLFCMTAACAASADVTGNVPTMQVTFDDKTLVSTGSATVTASGEGTATWPETTTGFGIDTSKYTPYGNLTSVFTANQPSAISVAATLGTKANGIMIHFKNGNDAIVLRRGAASGTLVLTLGNSTDPVITVENIENGDTAYHLYTVNILSDGIELYVDGESKGSSSATSCAVAYVNYQYGSRHGGCKTGEAKNGGCIDDVRVYPAALTPKQMVELGESLGIEMLPITILPIPLQVLTPGEPCVPGITIVDFTDSTTYTVGGGISSEYFDVEYSGNAAIGTATVTVTGKGAYAGVSRSTTFTIVGRFFVKPGAASGGDGLSWETAAPLRDALASAATGGEVWLQAGTYSPEELQSTPFSPTGPVNIFGGFAGNETSIDERDASGRSIFDGGNTAGSLNAVTNALELQNAAAAPVVIEQIEFVRGRYRGLNKSGGGNLTLRNCAFRWNRPYIEKDIKNIYGFGAYFSGGNSAKIVVTNCVFDGNALTGAAQMSGHNGAGFYAADLASISVDDSLFITNGASSTAAYSDNTPARDGLSGSAIYATSAPLHARNCRFVGNRGAVRNKTGGCVSLNGASGGSTFDHCLFLGNYENWGWYATPGSTSGSGALYVSLSTADAQVAVTNCTFAYNVAECYKTSAGITVAKGCLVIRNSIVYGNYTKAASDSGSDLTVLEGTVDADYSLFTADETSSIKFASGTTRLFGSQVAFGDPLFETTLSEALACIAGESENGKLRYDAEHLADVLAFDVHLQSPAGYVVNSGVAGEKTGYSPAIDAGDPAGDCSLEPAPNGGIVDAGCYGNTPEASRSSTGTPSLTAADVSISFSDQTQPTVVATLGGSGTFNSSVLIEAGDEDFAQGGASAVSQSFSGVGNGASATLADLHYYTPGAAYYVRVTVTSPSLAEPIVVSLSATVTGTTPDFVGRGGGDGVIHVRAGAHGYADGSDWANAYTDINAALAAALAANGTVEEIWVAGTMHAEGNVQHNVTAELTIRGGFAGTESSADERADGVYSILDGIASNGSTTNACLCAMGNSPLTIERIEFRNGFRNAYPLVGAVGLGCTTAGSFATVRDCRFTNVIRNFASGGICGGLYVHNNCNVVVTNCVFEGIILAFKDNDMNKGVAMEIASGANARVYDTRFIANGIPFEHDSQETSLVGARGTRAMINVASAALYMENCEFRANRLSSRPGGIIKFTGACGGSSLKNCLFAGNQMTIPYKDGYLENGAGAGIVQLAREKTTAARNDWSLPVVGCTFAYNFYDAPSTGSLGGIYVDNGTAGVTNCIFYGNATGQQVSDAAGRGIYCTSNGIANVAFSLFESANDLSDVSDGQNTLNVGTGIIYDDPKFVSTKADFRLLFDSSVTTFSENGDITAPQFARFRSDALADALALDCHLAAKSPAIDAGDPTSDWRLEPKPNGRRVNLGYYGNTPWATMSASSGLFIIVR